MYSYYEIECPNCGHRFLWLEHSWSSCGHYRRKGHDEILESTECPKCVIKMVLLKESNSGIVICDESIEVVDGIYGI